VSGDNKNEPRPRVWLGCLAMLALFVGVLVLITEILSSVLRD
jgi:hypothetical protein